MICQHIAVEDLLQLFALFAVSNIPLVRFQQFCGIFLTEIRCLQCLQITDIHLKHIFVSLFAGKYLGVILNNKGNLSDHLKQVKGKCEATTQLKPLGPLFTK